MNTRLYIQLNTWQMSTIECSRIPKLRRRIQYVDTRASFAITMRIDRAKILHERAINCGKTCGNSFNAKSFVARIVRESQKQNFCRASREPFISQKLGGRCIPGGMRWRVAKLRRSVANSIFETPGSSEGWKFASVRSSRSPCVASARRDARWDVLTYVPMEVSER